MSFDDGSTPPHQAWGAPPPPPPAGNPPGYIAPSGYGWGAPPREHPNGTTILVLGILSLVVCGVLGPFAWSMGNRALREMDSQPGANWTNRSNVNAGRICGIIGSCILVLSVAWVILWVGLFASLASR